MPGFCCPFVCHFWGVFRCLLQLFMDEVRAGHCCFKRPGPRGHFLAEIRIRSSIFPPTQRKIVHWSPFLVDLEKSSSFPFQFKRFLLHHWSFQLCDADCCHPAYYGTAWINISNCSCITNATYQTGAQSKISLKIQSSPQTVHPSGKSHLSHSQERSLMLVSRCAVVCWMATGCVRKLKAPVVKHKLFELEQKAWRFFQADQERGPMDYLSLRWREKSSCELEFQQENGLAVQVFQNGSVQPWLCL